MALTKSGAKKILIIFTAANTAAVLAAAIVFSIAIRSDLGFIQESVLRYASQTALERGKSAETLLSGKTASLADASRILESYGKRDPRILYIIIFSKTSDENFFRVSAKIDTGKHITIPIETGQRVREESEDNWLKKGLYEACVNQSIFSDKSSYWHNSYIPLSLKEGQHVARFMVSSTDAVIALEDHFAKVKRLEGIIVIGTIIVITITLIAAFLFLRNFSLFISGITGYVKKAASGETNISLNEDTDEDISELALSFNTLVGELREKEKLIADLTEKEQAVLKSVETVQDSAAHKELLKEIDELRLKLSVALAEKNQIEQESSKLDELSESFRKGVDLLKENNLSNAETVFTALTIIKPDGFGAYFNLGVVYAKMRKLDRALEMFEKARTINPGHAHTETYIEKVTRLKTVIDAS
jgi:hypothetical protein